MDAGSDPKESWVRQDKVGRELGKALQQGQRCLVLLIGRRK